PCLFFLRGRCRFGQRCTDVHDRKAATAAAADAKRDRIEAEARQEAAKPTLLRALLAPALRKESSVILQCIRFFVDNDFLVDDAGVAAATAADAEAAAAAAAAEASTEASQGRRVAAAATLAEAAAAVVAAEAAADNGEVEEGSNGGDGEDAGGGEDNGERGYSDEEESVEGGFDGSVAAGMVAAVMGCGALIVA
ncbi:unnamed protein product, partial [Phaeothamnion confervicola]